MTNRTGEGSRLPLFSSITPLLQRYYMKTQLDLNGNLVEIPEISVANSAISKNAVHWIRCPVPKDPKQIPFRHVAVWSFIKYRNNSNINDMSQQYVADTLRIDKESVYRSVRFLRDNKLLDGSKLIALDRPELWRTYGSSDNEWSIKYLLPSEHCPLSPEGLVVFGWLLSFPVGQSVRSIHRMTNVHRMTIARTFETLQGWQGKWFSWKPDFLHEIETTEDRFQSFITKNRVPHNHRKKLNKFRVALGDDKFYRVCDEAIRDHDPNETWLKLGHHLLKKACGIVPAKKLPPADLNEAEPPKPIQRVAAKVTEAVPPQAPAKTVVVDEPLDHDEFIKQLQAMNVEPQIEVPTVQTKTETPSVDLDPSSPDFNRQLLARLLD